MTVVTTNRTSGEARTFVTDANGQFIAPDLAPGRYNVRFELTGFTVVERTDISVVLGRAFELNTQLSVGALTEVVQVTGEASPLVDLRSTLIAHNVASEEIDRLPKGRSFQSLALTAPSVNAGEIEGGFQVNGASGAENAFTVDGIVTNSLVNGQSRQNTVFEYLQEVQVKTSGIAAEYGGALGGVMSAVTKSGGNTFRGETHYYYEGSAVSAGPVRRLVLEPHLEQTALFVQDRESPDHQQEFGGSAGGPIMRDRLFFFGSFSPRNERKTNSYTYLDGNQDIRQGHLASAGLRQADVRVASRHRELVHAVDAHQGHGNAFGIRRRHAQHRQHHALVGAQPDRPRLRDQSGQHERVAGPEPLPRLVRQPARRAVSRPLLRLGHPARSRPIPTATPRKA